MIIAGYGGTLQVGIEERRVGGFEEGGGVARDGGEEGLSAGGPGRGPLESGEEEFCKIDG